MEKDLKMDLSELEKKSRNAKEEQARAFQEMFNQLEESLTQSLSTKLESIEKSIKKETALSNVRHLATKRRQQKTIRMLKQIWEKIPQSKTLFQKIKG